MRDESHLPFSDDRMQAAARCAAELPHLSLEELDSQTDLWHTPPYAATEILPGLFQGGTEDDDVVYRGRTERYANEVPYDVIVTLYATAQPAPWGVEEFRYGFGDSDLQSGDLKRVLRAAQLAYRRWAAGDSVLVRCQAGMNRSGLVMALVLMQAGLGASQAIGLIRTRRSPGALFNRSFLEWLMTEGEQVAAWVASPVAEWL